MKITIITPTRNRGTAFGLLEKWMGRQTYSGEIQWIVVNDGAEPYKYHLGQEVLRRQPQIGEIHSLCSNILFALPHVRGEAVIIAEDDDWLAPNYLERTVAALGKADLTGSAPAIYYNLAVPSFRVLDNREHCSLGQSAFHTRVLPLLEKIAREGDPMIDQKLWREWTGSRHIFPNSPTIHVSIKSMPGEQGIGKGHSLRGEKDGPSLRQLSRFIGEDAGDYRKIYRQFGRHSRTGIINRLIARRGYRSYLEIGLGNGDHFHSVQCAEKESVDSGEEAHAATPTHRMTSDDFFASNRRRYDLIFIDGLHHRETVYRDICNALATLSPDGMVVCHDMNPTTEKMQTVPRETQKWTGDCWKAWVQLRRERPELPVAVADTDYGVGVIFPDGKSSGVDGMPGDGELTWQNLERNRRRWLNLVSVDAMELWIAGQAMPSAAKNDLEQYFARNTGRQIHKWKHYFEIYDRHFSRFRGTDVRVLEFGVAHGGSLHMWRHYFGPKAKIYGVDINPRCKELEEDRIEIITGDQGDRAFLRSLTARIPRIDILIDDGGHRMTQQTNTFEELFPHVDSNGVYLCEDLHTSYWPEYDGGYQKPETFLEYSKGLIDQINAWHSVEKDRLAPTAFTRSTHSLHYYDSILVIEKRPITKPFHLKTGTPAVRGHFPAELEAARPPVSQRGDFSQMKNDEEQEYLLIVGMHRSGTSMLAHLMVKLGYHIGKNPTKPASDNPEGFFENKALKCFHERLLKSMGTSWSDTRSIQPELLKAQISADAFSEFASMLESEFRGHGKRLVKDPRMCRLMPFWNGVLQKLGTKSVRCLLPIRHPMNVAGSLQKRNGFPIRRGLLLWMQNVLAAEHGTRGYERMVTIYDDVLAGKGASALAGFLGLSESLLDAAIEQVANPSLRHEFNGEPAHGEMQAVERVALRIWDQLSASAYKNDVDERSMDGLRKEYQSL